MGIARVLQCYPEDYGLSSHLSIIFIVPSFMGLDVYCAFRSYKAYSLLACNTIHASTRFTHCTSLSIWAVYRRRPVVIPDSLQVDIYRLHAT